MANADKPSLTRIFACYGVRTVHRDEKNRFTIPAKMRPDEEDELSEYLLVRNTKEESMFLLFPPSQVAKLSDEALQAVALVSCPVHIDKSGRILIPAAFQRAATGDNTEKTDLIMVGRGNHFELWTPEKWAGVKSQRIEEAKRAIDQLTNDQT